METKRLHIVFSDSAAGDLQRALSQAGHKDRVIEFPDNLSFGPIAGVDFDTRTEWVRETFGDLSDIYSREAQDAFWRDALSEDASRVVWLSRRSTWEFAGFLEFIWRLGDAPCEVVDLTDFVLPERVINGRQYPSFLPGSLAMLTSDQILDFDLLDQAEPLTTTQRDQYRSAWTTLRNENADLRVIDDQLNLVSAPITYFDQQLMSGAEERWLKSARIIGQTMATFLDDLRYQAGDSFLASRVRALVKAGFLEGAGDLWQIRFSEVRLPPSQA
jgi:hypothetical protein